MAQDPKLPESLPVGPAAVVSAGFRAALANMISHVRTRTRDFPELNRLIAGKESSDTQIAYAIMETIDDWNTTPPLISAVMLESFPSPSLLVTGAVSRLMGSVATLEVRNNMQYSDGQGVQVSSSTNGPLLRQWSNLLGQEYEGKKRQVKMALNLGSAMNGSGIASQYSYLTTLIDSGALE
tara:strand:- start:63 stop:605 length:543 start_codon:yes stop_codon:yes gene_type:complete